MTTTKWLLPFKCSRKNYENVGCLPYALEHDRGFAGDKLYRIVRQMPDGGFLYILEGGPYYNRPQVLKAIRQKYAEALSQ